MAIFKQMLETRPIRRNIDLAIEIEALRGHYAELSDLELQTQTAWFKERLAKGETLDDLLIEVYALVREVAYRVKGEFPYTVQVIGGVVLHDGDIAEMKTGEGKTLTATMPVYLNALEGKGVHVVTANEYLAERDAESNGEIYRFLGLSVGVNKKGMTRRQKQAAFKCDITYTTASELGFDYLRDNMVKKLSDKVLRGMHYALVDECDSVLIDEARTPLVISGAPLPVSGLYKEADNIIRSLKEGDDYEVDTKEGAVTFTETGIRKIERDFASDLVVPKLFTPENADFVHYLIQALRAHTLFDRDVDYVVQDGEVLIVDPHTGRTMPGRQYSDGLHQAITVKEGLDFKKESRTVATITFQNFFRLYDKLAGMTGTASPEEDEFLKVYNMRTIKVPTNRPVIRVDAPDRLFPTKAQKYTALIKEVVELHKTGRPVLIGTADIDTSELISHILCQTGIKHEVLNAKNPAKEAEIIAKAGRFGAVTVATDMAGRGTDIKLSPGVADLGGLAVIGSERHESRRIDDQLRGRAGRQGDPGYSCFYVSMEDEMIMRYMPERSGAIRFTEKDVRNAQEIVEGINYDMRIRLLQFDESMRKQRDVIYTERDRLLETDPHESVRDLFVKCIDITKGDKKRLMMLGFKYLEGATNILTANDLFKAWDIKTKEIKSERPTIERQTILSVLDKEWTDHIDVMAKLRQGISLRSYSQEDPLAIYDREAFDLFSVMMDNIAIKVTKTLHNMIVKTV